LLELCALLGMLFSFGIANPRINEQPLDDEMNFEMFAI